MLQFVGAWTGKFLDVVQGVIGEAGLEGDVGSFKGGLDGIVARPGNIVFEHGLLHRPGNLHILPAFAKAKAPPGIDLELTRQLIGPHRRHIPIIPDSKIFIPVAKGRRSPDLGGGYFIKGVTANESLKKYSSLLGERNRSLLEKENFCLDVELFSKWADVSRRMD